MIEQLKELLIKGITDTGTQSIKLSGKTEAYQEVLNVITQLESQPEIPAEEPAPQPDVTD